MFGKIKKIDVRTCHGSNVEVVDFSIDGFPYYAKKEWNRDGSTKSIVYGRSLPNQYYHSISTIRGTGGLENQLVECVFGDFPEDLYNAILAL